MWVNVMLDRTRMNSRMNSAGNESYLIKVSPCNFRSTATEDVRITTSKITTNHSVGESS